MKRRTNPCEGQSKLRAIQARKFFVETLGHLVKQGYSSEQISAMLSAGEFAGSIERLGSEGVLDSYLPVPWDQIAGIDIRYRGTRHGLRHHEFVLEVNGKEHDRFEFPFPDLSKILRN